jgi:hypothetical protein
MKPRRITPFYGLDFDLTVSDAYGVRGLPYTIYLDVNGIVRAVYAGQANRSRLYAYPGRRVRRGVAWPAAVEIKLISSIPATRLTGHARLNIVSSRSAG